MCVFINDTCIGLETSIETQTDKKQREKSSNIGKHYDLQSRPRKRSRIESHSSHRVLHHKVTYLNMQVATGSIITWELEDKEN